MTEVISEQKIDIRGTLKEAWNGVKGFEFGYGNKFKIWIALFVLMAAQLFFKLVFLAIPFVSAVLSFFILTPMVVGLLMMGVRIVMKQPLSLKNQFDFYPKIINIFLMTLLMVVSVLFVFGLGSLLAALLGSLFEWIGVVGVVILFFGVVLVNVIYLYALLLLVDQRLGVWVCITRAAKGFFRNGWRLLLVFMIGGCLEIFIFALPIVALTLGAPEVVKVIAALLVFSIIWVVPWSLCVFALTYRHIFGVKSFEAQ